MVFIVLNIYSQCKKKLSVRLEVTTFTLQYDALPRQKKILKIIIKKREVVFVRLELTTFMLYYIARHSTCPQAPGGQNQTNF